MLDRIAIAQHNGPSEDVLEFAHIAWPRVTQQPVQRAEGEFFRRRRRADAMRFENVMGQQEDIAAAFTQWRERERQNVESIE